MESTLVVLGSDHAGFRLKAELRKYLENKKIPWLDLGARELDKKDDYPDYAKKVAEFVSRGGSLGILICATGSGMCMSANKVKGIRAAAAHTIQSAKLARQHNNANILCLGSKFVTPAMAKRIVNTFLKEKFQAGRHLRRINKIKKIEESH